MVRLQEMEISTDIKNNIRYQAVKGVIDIDKLIKYLEQIYKVPEFNPNMDVFWDLREADFSSVSTEAIYNFIGFVGKYWGKEKDTKAALVVSDDLGFGLSRMYEMLLETDSPSQINIFRDIDKAEEWINEYDK